jgi:hypothetical protein
MNMAIKREVLQAHLADWLAAKGNKKKRGELTAKLSRTLSMNPKSIGRSMLRIQLKDKRKEGKRGRSCYYTKDVDAALFTIWKELDYPCAENLHSSVDSYIGYFEADRKWSHSDSATGKLRSMSLGTMKNRVTSFRRKQGMGKGRSATVASPLKGMIPIRKSYTWSGLPPGYVQTDSVVHCGDILTGDVLYSVGYVDFATYWSDYITQWNKGMLATGNSLETLRQRMPFPLLELHPDTGNEFINHHILRWANEHRITLTRSEPYKKNDNMCVEERNGSIVRKHLGVTRMDDSSLVELTSELLRVACILHNHFRPVRRMTNKERPGAKWKRTFEKVALTPYARVLAHPGVSETDKKAIRSEHENLNPLVLKRELDRLKSELGRKLEIIRKKRAIR